MLSGKTRVAVLRGGPSHGYSDSLKTGGFVLSLLRSLPEQYEPIDIFISRDGLWHHEGLVSEPHKILSRADLVWNALHGQYGESGEVQQLLSSLQKPFTGSGIAGAAFSHNKELSKKLYQDNSLLTPESSLVVNEANYETELVKIFQNYIHPVVVKPATGVRGEGIRLAHTFPELKEAVRRAFSHSEKVMIEEYVRGTVVTCAVVEWARGERLYALLPVHVETEHRRARPKLEEVKRIEEMSRVAHEALGLNLSSLQREKFIY
jgi:D-alanine-D-alanine ligase